MSHKGTKITVTQEDIEKGRRGDYGACPIALAIKRAIPDGGFISVDDEEILVGHNRFESIEAVWSFVYSFDAGDAVEPFEFTLGENTND